MSSRLQVPLQDREMEITQRIARRERPTVSERGRRLLRVTRTARPTGRVGRTLDKIERRCRG
ncbi:MAG TPA: hypothetical protein VMU19_11935 [Bryobacteraceae bacterium]|nr:hypothetical protein [Bryobacteraceae bacterium]